MVAKDQHNDQPIKTSSTPVGKKHSAQSLGKQRKVSWVKCQDCKMTISSKTLSRERCYECTRLHKARMKRLKAKEKRDD